MSIKWLLQDTSRNFSVINEEVQSLLQNKFSIQNFGTIPFTNKMTGLQDLSDTDDYIVRCGTKVIDIVFNNKLEGFSSDIVKKIKAGLSYDFENFDQKYYGQLDLPLLNNDMQVLPVSNNLNLTFDTIKFVKPTSDLKSFTAGIIEPGVTLKDFITNGYHQENYIEENALISKCKKIFGEYRFICLNEEILGASRYQKNGQLVINTDIPFEVIIKAKDYVKLYKPSDIFTMDLCETPEGVKIVEYNCWNCSGLYAMNQQELFAKIQNYYLKK